jgi:hypothetical protein
LLQPSDRIKKNNAQTVAGAVAAILSLFDRLVIVVEVVVLLLLLLIVGDVTTMITVTFFRNFSYRDNETNL